jgi:hypothetical protein
MRMSKIREVAVSGFSPDPNPNVTSPVSGTMKMVGASGDSGSQVEGHRICIRFVDNSNLEVVGPTADFRTWIRDEGASDTVPNGGLGRPAWLALKAEAAAPSSQSYAGAIKGEIFVQLTALGTVGSATKVQVWAEESTSVPG